MIIRLFHVSMRDMQAGDILQPGNWGASLRRFSKSGQRSFTAEDMKNFFWELPLEAAHRALAPAAPSRLDCVFTCLNYEDAVVFRDRFRSGWKIYEVEPTGEWAMHYGDYDLITLTGDAPYIDHWSTRAVQYWMQAPIGMCEVLVGGPIKIIRRLGYSIVPVPRIAGNTP